MLTIHRDIPVGRECIRVSRTPMELGMLVTAIQETPDEWYVYSRHIRMTSAHNRASRLRHHTPNALLPYMDRLEFKAYNHEQDGAVVLVRWRGGDTRS